MGNRTAPAARKGNIFMKLILTLLSLFAATEARAYTVPLYRDLKPSTQVMLEHDHLAAPVANSTNYILTTNDGPSSAAAVVINSGFAHQPDMPRNITITPTGTTGDVEACVVTVAGSNIAGAAISEDFTFLANASTVQTGNKAFKTVSSISWPANCESGGFAATWIVGVGVKMGLRKCLAQGGDLAWAVANATFEGTRPTVAVSASARESNTVITNTAPDASKSFDLYYVQNYLCP